jgi:iron complex outermembrane receptor protein
VSLPWQVDLDAMLFAVGGIDEIQVPAYARVDARLAWRPRPRIELSVVGQNLFDRRHVEFGGAGTNLAQSSEVRRTAYGGMTWHF